MVQWFAPRRRVLAGIVTASAKTVLGAVALLAIAVFMQVFG